MSVQALSAERQIGIYTQMLRIREFEERVKRTFTEHPGVIRGHTHLADGAEASIVGSLCHFRGGDAALATYRCHGYPLALGSDPKAMMAEIYGRVDGLCKGLGGSMHLTDVKNGFLGTSGIVGAGIPHAAGAAWAAQIRKKNEVVYCFFGDGASKQGAFHETLNIASLWKLPVIFVMENNGYNVVTTSAQEDANAANGEPLSVKAKAYSMPGVTVDGTDPLAVYAAAHGNIIAPPGVPLHYPEHEAITVFGKREEYEAALRGDPVPRFRAALVKGGVLTPPKADELGAQVAKEMDEAVTFAVKSPYPKLESALDNVYA
jgi:TPP-dependent pyruvate/acetoin dehydrogenase alpha subunit